MMVRFLPLMVPAKEPEPATYSLPMGLAVPMPMLPASDTVMRTALWLASRIWKPLVLVSRVVSVPPAKVRGVLPSKRGLAAGRIERNTDLPPR